MSYEMEPISVTTATFTLTDAHSGTTLFLNRAGGIAFTLPAPDAGLTYDFVIGTANTSDCTISSNGGANIIVVSVNELETDTTEDGPWDDNADVVTFVANLGSVGDYIHFKCDGTYWYGRGQVKLDGAVTSGTT